MTNSRFLFLGKKGIGGVGRNLMNQTSRWKEETIESH